MFNVEEVVILEMFDMTDEEKSGVHKLIDQILDNVSCKICLLSGEDEGKLRIENYGMTDQEDEIFMKYLGRILDGDAEKISS